MGGYTPGPWWADASRYGTVYIEANAVIDKRLLQEICAVGPTESGRGQQLANARLIAAAPTLLEAAQRVTAAFRSLGESRSLIADFELHKECEAAMLALDAAISRATGEGE